MLRPTTMVLNFKGSSLGYISSDTVSVWRSLRTLYSRRARGTRRRLPTMLLTNKPRTRTVLLVQDYDVCRCEWTTTVCIAIAGDVVIGEYLDDDATCNPHAVPQCTDMTIRRDLSRNLTAQMLQLAKATPNSINGSKGGVASRQTQNSSKLYDAMLVNFYRVRRTKRDMHKTSHENKQASGSEPQKSKHTSKRLRKMKSSSKPNQLKSYQPEKPKQPDQKSKKLKKKRENSKQMKDTQLKKSTNISNELKNKKRFEMQERKKRNNEELTRHKQNRRMSRKLQKGKMQLKALNKRNKSEILNKRKMKSKELKKKKSQVKKSKMNLKKLQMKTRKTNELERYKRNKRVSRKHHRGKKKPKRRKKKRKRRKKKPKRRKKKKKKAKKRKKSKNKSKKGKKNKSKKHKKHRPKSKKHKNKKKKHKHKGSKLRKGKKKSLAKTKESEKEGETKDSEKEEETKDSEKHEETKDSEKQGDTKDSKNHEETKDSKKHEDTTDSEKYGESNDTASPSNSSSDEETPKNQTELENETLDTAVMEIGYSPTTAAGAIRNHLQKGTSKKKEKTTSRGLHTSHTLHASHSVPILEPEVGESVVNETTLASRHSKTRSPPPSLSWYQSPATIACIVLVLIAVLMVLMYFFFPFKKTNTANHPFPKLLLSKGAKNTHDEPNNSNDSAMRDKLGSSKSDESDLEKKLSSTDVKSSHRRANDVTKDAYESPETPTSTEVSSVPSASPVKQDTSDVAGKSDKGSPSPPPHPPPPPPPTESKKPLESGQNADSAAPVQGSLKQPNQSTNTDEKSAAASDNKNPKKKRKSFLKRLSGGRKQNTNENVRHTYYNDDDSNYNTNVNRRRRYHKKSSDYLFSQLLRQRCRSLGEPFTYYSLPTYSSDSD